MKKKMLVYEPVQQFHPDLRLSGWTCTVVKQNQPSVIVARFYGTSAQQVRELAESYAVFREISST